MNNTKKDRYAVFFLNTGRCGSQFFATQLAKHFDDIARVEHEPAQQAYEPRRYFSMIHSGDNIEISPQLKKHFDSIDETLQSKHYIETGWPAYGILPHLIERFEGRVKIVHLFRHPLRVAASLTTHSVYNRGEWSSRMSLTPEDCGVRQACLAGEQWNEMDEFCKCLFWWTEINRFALDLKKKTDRTPWLSIRFEDVFDSNDDEPLRTLCEFLEFPEREVFLKSKAEKVDMHQAVAKNSIDIELIEQYKETIQLMSELGYSLADVDRKEIRSRYQASFKNRATRGIKSITKRWLKRLRRTTS